MKDPEANSVRGGSETVDSEDLNPKHLKQASEIATALARAHKSRQLYNKNNPVPRGSLDRFLSSLTIFLEDNDTLTFWITEAEFLFHKKAVYSNPDRRESLAFKLYRDGVRAITFHDGITRDEIVGLLDILEQVSVETAESDNDVVTQIWERDFAHITYMAIDECIDRKTSTEGSLADGQLGCGPPSTMEEQTGDGPGAVDMLDLPLTEDDREAMADVTLTEEELEEIGQQILAEEKEDPKKRVFQILVDILHGSATAEIKTDVARGIRALFMDLLDAGNAAEAVVFLAEIRNLIKKNRSPTTEALFPKSLEEALEGFLETLGQEKQILRIEPGIEEAASHQLEEYEQYLCQLLPSSVGPLCGMLGRMKSRRGREMLCRVLGVLARENLDALVDMLSDPRWYLVRNLVCVLRIMKDKRALPHLEGLLMHQDVRVRTEVVHCIAELDGEGPEILMRRCLRDPQRGVRAVAAKRLGQVGGSRAASFLVECVLEKSFLDRTFDEKWEFFDALGRAGSDDVIPVLEKLLRKRSVFHSTETEEMKKCSATALARIGTPGAVRVLEELSRGLRGETGKACAEALRLCTRREDG